MNQVLTNAVRQMMASVNPVRRLRKKFSLQAIQLAENAKLSEQTIWKLETGATTPRVETLYKIAGALGVPGETLISCYYQWMSALKGGSPETILRTVSADPNLYIKGLGGADADQ